MCRIYVALGVLAAGVFLAMPDGVAAMAVFVVTAFVPIPVILVAVRRNRLPRPPWYVVVLALCFLSAGNVRWLVAMVAEGRASGRGTVADLLFTVGYVLLLAGALVLLRARRRSDRGGVLDTAMLSIVGGGVVWQYVMQPNLAATGISASSEVVNLVRLLALIAVVGVFARVAKTSHDWIPALGYLFGALALALVTLVASAALRRSPEEVIPWTQAVRLVSYCLLGAAALHSSSALIAQPGRKQVDRLNRGRLVLLGAALLVTPALGAVAQLRGRTPDAVLLLVGSCMVVPLVMTRIGLLVNERAQAEEALAHQATHDALTGLANRASFVERLDDALARLDAGAVPDVLVLFADLDGFKQVNDTLGHEAGDALLVATAQRLRGALREGDLVARFGGDEFLMLVPGLRQGPESEQVCRRIEDRLVTPVQVGDELVAVRASVGAASAMAAQARTSDALIRVADAAMYAEKQRRRKARAASAGATGPRDGGAVEAVSAR